MSGSRISCLICHECIESGEHSILCVENGHEVHFKCLKSWVKAARLLCSQEIYCPICHSPYPPDIVKELFNIKQEYKESNRKISVELQLVDEEEKSGISSWEAYARKLNLAQTAIDQYNFEMAILYLFEILTANPDDVEANFLFGVINFQRNNYVLAQHFFMKTLQLDPRHYLAALLLAEIFLKDGKKREAIEMFKRARNALDPLLTREEKERSEDWLLIKNRLKTLTRVNYL